MAVLVTGAGGGFVIPREDDVRSTFGLDIRGWDGERCDFWPVPSLALNGLSSRSPCSGLRGGFTTLPSAF